MPLLLKRDVTNLVGPDSGADRLADPVPVPSFRVARIVSVSLDKKRLF